MTATTRAPSTTLIRVLLVEDDPIDHRLVVDLLDQVPMARFLIDWARSLADGLDRLAQATFDVCLLDTDLPDGNGLDLLASADTLGLKLPMIVLTGSPSIEQDQHALALGASAFLEKDKLDPPTLERTIRYAVHHRNITLSLACQAFVDERTGLISASLYRERLDRALAFARRRDLELAVMMIDLAIDHDPAFADHRLIDAILAAVGQRLAGALRETDSIARLSGSRLALLIEGTRNLDHAAAVARKAFRLLRSPIEIDDQTIAPVPSVGVAVYPREGGTGDALMRQAEAAMRRAMGEGGGCCRFASERIDHEAREGAILEKAFNIAFQRRELRLRFHPEVHQTGRPAGLAGLIFWRHPVQGWLPMDRMLANADDEVLIKGIVDWSLAAAAEHIRAWQVEGLKPPRLSLAIPFLQRPALAILKCAVFEQVVRRHIAPQLIEIDLQEDLVLEDARRGYADLASLKATGIRLALDDFGKGRTAIQDLRHDLLDGLKLTPELHRDLPGNQLKETRVRALINLGHNLGLDVTARDARDQQLFALLKRLGCDAIQLTALSPMGAAAAAAWLRSTGGETPEPTSRAEILVPKIRPPSQADIKSPPPITSD